MAPKYILAIDQGTSSTKSVIFDQHGTAIAKGHEELTTFFRDEGHVEQDPIAIYNNVLASVAKCLTNFREAGRNHNEIACIGISNQRETFVIWDDTGKPLYNAIVWQCKRSIAICNRLNAEGLKDTIKARTGLILDPYFSATKLIWLNENNAAVREGIANGKAYFGTVDTWLLFKLTEGKNYLTDHTNASRTMFFNLKTLEWDQVLLEKFGLSKINLPEVRHSANDFGKSDLNGLLDREVPITAMIGDSHAAAFGEGCFEKGQAKATLGTGCSIMMNAGEKLPERNEGIVSTICWSIPNRVDYALEGVIVSCGSTMEWLRTALGLFNHVEETGGMATDIPDNNGVYIIPAFSGLGAPFWDMSRTAEIHGLTFDCTKKHLVRAGLESIAYQIRDVIDAMKSAGKLDLKEISVNGGIISNRFVLEFLTDLIAKPLSIGIPDASGLGAAYLAGLGAGIFKDIDDVKNQLKLKSVVSPNPDHQAVQDSYKKWIDYLNYSS
jgi:glycerol kinase